MTRTWRAAWVWAGLAAGFALAAAIAAGIERAVIFEAAPPSYRDAIRFASPTRESDVDARPPRARLSSRAPEVEVDPRRPPAWIPRRLPGPHDGWAGSTTHALRFRLGRLERRDLLLDLLVEDSRPTPPPHLAVTVNEVVVDSLDITPETDSHDGYWGGRARYRIRISAPALGDGSEVRLAIVNEFGSWVAWERIRLVDARGRFALAHLARRGRFPPRAASLLAASLAVLLLWGLASSPVSPDRWLLRVAGPALALILLGLGGTMPRGSLLVAQVPRGAWLALPWGLLALRAPTLGRRALQSAEGEAPALRPAARPGGRSALARAGSLVVNGTLSLTALAASLLGAEIAIRVAFREVQSAGDTRTYFHRRVHGYNSLGFYEREFELVKPSNTYRIAAIGDSLTMNIAVPPSQRYTTLLEEALNEHRRPDRAYEVLNFGRAGADTVDHVAILRDSVLGVDPDFILLQWYINDVENHSHAGRRVPAPLLPVEPLHQTLLRSSALYPLLDMQWASLQEALGLVESHPAYMYRRFGDPESPSSVDAADRLDEFIGEGKRAHRPVGIVLFPHPGPDLTAGAYVYDYLHNRVLEACRREHVTCLDLRSAFARVAHYRQLWVNRLDPHPSAFANRLAAERMLETFGPIWRGASPGPGA